MLNAVPLVCRQSVQWHTICVIKRSSSRSTPNLTFEEGESENDDRHILGFRELKLTWLNISL